MNGMPEAFEPASAVSEEQRIPLRAGKRYEIATGIAHITRKIRQGEKEHAHDFDEIIAFIGSNRNNPRDLGGEIEVWMGGEPYSITKSSYIFIPKGLKHCPIIIKRLDTPVFMYESANSPGYTMK